MGLSNRPITMLAPRRLKFWSKQIHGASFANVKPMRTSFAERWNSGHEGSGARFGSYRPDCDYVDGELLERNVGEHGHSDLQTELAYYFRARRQQWRLHAVVEQRVQVKPSRFRIPDVCIVKAPGPHPAIFREPPFICIEVLSKDD